MTSAQLHEKRRIFQKGSSSRQVVKRRKGSHSSKITVTAAPRHVWSATQAIVHARTPREAQNTHGIQREGRNEHRVYRKEGLKRLTWHQQYSKNALGACHVTDDDIQCQTNASTGSQDSGSQGGILGGGDSRSPACFGSFGAHHLFLNMTVKAWKFGFPRTCSSTLLRKCRGPGVKWAESGRIYGAERRGETNARWDWRNWSHASDPFNGSKTGEITDQVPFSYERIVLRWFRSIFGSIFMLEFNIPNLCGLLRSSISDKRRPMPLPQTHLDAKHLRQHPAESPGLTQPPAGLWVPQKSVEWSAISS